MLRRLIIRWLFKYPMPEYFHAIEYYKHIKWRLTVDTTAYKIVAANVTLGINVHDVLETSSGSNYWVFVSDCERKEVHTYAEMIVVLDNILRYGLINPPIKQQ